ncbi:MAG: hypothetical protein CMF23_15565 [Ignavibacteriae bacterium]|nr:hypothetical protein [Ignavibacteriota bacterium]MBZ0179243.1 hypothetical protein [Melioribacteraceae bacterium]MCO6474598.1 hypothetical protein [Melioribacteraceae bacterium]MDD3557166.1 hypothetical protein [Melioribacteraceae bacterium]
MQLIPEWAPNIHPLIVHFPIVFLISALFFDAAGLIFKKSVWLEKSAMILYAIGTLAIVITYFTGRSAADGLNIPAKVIPSVTDHADWAEITMWFFIIFSIVRLTIGLFLKSVNRTIVIVVVIIGLVGIYPLFQTGEHGAKLVFGYGLGTGNILKDDSSAVKTNNNNETQISNSNLTHNNDGSWKLNAGNNVVDILNDKFTWINGTIEDFSPMYNDENAALMFHFQDDIKNAGFIFDNKLASIQVTAKINIDNFNGVIELVHHFLDKNNYDFLGIADQKLSLSRKINGKIKNFEESSFSSKGWIELKLITDGSHFRGYINNKLILHGHGDEPEPGSIGILFSGKGNVSIRMIDAVVLEN